MPHADVVVIGAGLAGLTAALRLAESGAVVTLVAKGHASTHWGSGGIDVAAPRGARTPARGVAHLATLDDHPYSFLAADAGPAVDWLLQRLAAAGLPYAGTLETPIRRVPTAIGGTRRVAIVPDAQSAALRPWERDEILVVAGPAGFKDFWPAAIADSLDREDVWMGSDRPAHLAGIVRGAAGPPGAPQSQRARARAPVRRPGPAQGCARAVREGGREGSPRPEGTGRASRDRRARPPRGGMDGGPRAPAARAVRGAARPAQHPRHPPVAHDARADPRGGRAHPGR